MYLNLYQLLKRFILDLQVKKGLSQINLAYKIIPFGTNCMPRCITTFSGIKPTRQQGEKSLPFDLGFYDSLEKNIQLLDTHFKGFYNALKYDKKKKWYYNPILQAVFNHDGMLTKREFKERYEARIQNLYTYIKDQNAHLFFLISSSEPVPKKTFEHLFRVIQKLRSSQDFDIIFLCHSKSKMKYSLPNLHLISIDDVIFKQVNSKGNWAKELKKHRTKVAQKLYYPLVHQIITIIKSKQA